MVDASDLALPNEQPQQKPLRLWPGVLIVVLQWLVRFGVPAVTPWAIGLRFMGGLLGGLAVLVWWAFFSRAPRTERWGATGLVVAAMVATSFLLHESIAAGLGGLMYAIYAVPLVGLALVVSAAAGRHLCGRRRHAMTVAIILLACGVWTLFRSDGITGEVGADFTWRWTATPEERLLADAGDKPMTPPPTPVKAATGANWPGFRGPDRDGIVHGVRIETDWSASPPVELWRRPIGPACSSFAVRGALLYTQEQRGSDEVVSCYSVTTGEPVWRHRDATRFWDSHAGAGPRATPTLSGDHVYTLGATGILNVLNAGDGTVLWSRNAASDAAAKIPGWGLTSSPVVVDDVVIVAVVGTLVAYDRATGKQRWSGPDGGAGYSSPHLATIDGVAQVLLMSAVGATSFAPTDGTLLWKYAWPKERIVQPAVTADGDLLLSAGEGRGMRRIAVAHTPEGWTVQERWSSAQLRPNFNDFVVHKGHAFGFNQSRLACIEVKYGRRRWQGARYGGQIILLADQNLLLVLSEKGELALVAASPDQFTELVRFPAIEGKTWNHPVLVEDVLLIRNGQEMAAFRLPLAISL
jgi:outer membrane protein assembly factor BamB